MQWKRRFGVGAVLLILVAAFGVPSTLALAAGGAVFHMPSHASSTNWAGYAVSGAKGSVKDVKGSWIVPSIQGSCPSTDQYSSFWVGIDGYSSPSVEQTGTDSDCQGGSAVYYAWYEFYPKPSHYISSLTIHAGDTISAEVSFASGKFTTTLKDVSTGKSFSTSAAVKAQRTSAEWIAEAPSSVGGVLPLANFGTVSFGMDYTNVTSTNYATIGTAMHPIGGFTSVHSITMVNGAGTATKAQPSALSTNYSSFKVTWKSPGP